MILATSTVLPRSRLSSLVHFAPPVVQFRSFGFGIRPLASSELCAFAPCCREDLCRMARPFSQESALPSWRSLCNGLALVSSVQSTLAKVYENKQLYPPLESTLMKNIGGGDPIVSQISGKDICLEERSDEGSLFTPD